MPKLETADEKFINANATLNDLLSLTEKRDASDLHLAVDYPPILRVDGKLISLGGTPLTDERIQQLFDQILTQAQKEQLEKDLDIDFSHTHTTGSRFRINIFHKKGSLAGAFRLIPSRIRSIAELNLPSILYDLISIPQGLIILAGPTGSGKSTTIASMIQEVNLSQPKHIITIEDPIEYIFPKGTALINQREIGTDATSFKRALREVLREDPDVVLVGEMRDYEAISMTITTAETGHLVFSTLHTNSASQTVDRMIDVFPDAQQAQVRAQLANVISAVLSQRLVPVKGGGRKAVLEIMIATPAVRNAIREGKTYQIDNMIQTNAELGMITLEKSLIELIRAGEVTLEEAQTYTTKPEELISLMKNN
ncbi:PilT/PilU family type 4a pilus ATPase [Candidatus Dojkabacteria bacterium]|uniref:PilT/PilU family type 4a pilus ATPase n=1 Tax=Candidatus Dojkabacteria bacterium TaxID=2099670 RepID=A0A955L6M6_9BACT|nr:PilT/PilU family type 4a pilus ATPase [Candidatus Dojkabacteria bacterium]